MASKARPCFFIFLLLALSLLSQTQARESKFFSKFPRTVNRESKEPISLSPTQAPAPAPEAEVIEHGYGLYGIEAYRYPPTTSDPVKTTSFEGEEKYTPVEELEKYNFNGNGNGNGNGYVSEKQGMSDTRFLENGKYYYDVRQEGKGENTHFYKNGERNGNGKGNEYGTKEEEFNEHEEGHSEMKGNGNENRYVSEKQGMSDTRFLENGKYYYDVSQEGKGENTHFYENGEGNGNGKGNEYEAEEEEFDEHEEGHPEMKGNGNGNGNGYLGEKQGMSDTRFLENGKYYYDVSQEVKGGNAHLNGNGNGYKTEKPEFLENENRYPETQGKGDGYVRERQGMSDTRFMENGKYHYGNENGNGYETEKPEFLENEKFHYGNGNGNGNGYETQQQEFVADENSYPESKGHGNGNGYVTEKQGMSDTRFLENGKYFYDLNAEANVHPNTNNNLNEHFESEKQGMSDTRFLENGKYHYDVKNENQNGNPNNYYYFKNNFENDSGHSNNGNKFGNGYNYETRGHDGNSKKLPNTYDTIEEYEKEQEMEASRKYSP